MASPGSNRYIISKRETWWKSRVFIKNRSEWIYNSATTHIFKDFHQIHFHLYRYLFADFLIPSSTPWINSHLRFLFFCLYYNQYQCVFRKELDFYTFFYSPGLPKFVWLLAFQWLVILTYYWMKWFLLLCWQSLVWNDYNITK